MNQKVIFWGCGKIAREIYGKYKDVITLLYGISNNPKETTFIPEEGREYQVKNPENKGKSREGMIIICSAEYEKIAEQLCLLGYIPFVDFMDYELAEILWTGKSIVLLYGFCHLRGIEDCLKRAKHFSQKYAPIYYPNYLFLNFYQQERLQYLIGHCSVFIYGLALSQENYRKNCAILGRLDSQVKTLCLQSIYFGGYFPQKKRNYNRMNIYAVRVERYNYTPFSYGDSWLNECIAAGMGLEDIIGTIEEKDVYERDFILKYAEEEWKRLKYQEAESDFKVVGFMEDTYRKTRLFRNEMHMENIVLIQCAAQILQYLGCDTKMDAIDSPLLNCSQHFIYPCVAKALGLGWDVWQEELDLYTYAGWIKVTMREYIQRYYETCKDIWQLKERHMLP